MEEGEVNSKTLVGEAIETAPGVWPENREEVVKHLKERIKKRTDFTRALAIESKKDSRDNLKIALEIIFSESNLASEPAEEIAAKAANDRRFLRAIDDLHQYYSYQKNAQSEQYKIEIQRKELQLHKIKAHPYFRSLEWLLETSSLYSQTGTSQSESEHEKIDDIILGTLKFVSDIGDEIPATDLKTEYQQLLDQAENFAVALIDEVRDEEELSTVIEMENKLKGVDDEFTWKRGGIQKVSLIQHAINLRCKAFVVSKNCQHLLKEVIFGRTFYRFWDDPRVKTGTGMPPLFILLMKVLLSIPCCVVMSIPPCSIGYLFVNYWWHKNKCLNGFCELYERPCQKYLLELSWFIAFLGLVITTSNDNNFSQKDLLFGLSIPYVLVAFFVLGFWVRFLTRILVCLLNRSCRKNPRYLRNWRILLPDILTVVEFASLLCFTISIIWWMIRWEQLDGWRPSDSDFQDIDIFYSLASLLCFFKLAHYLKAQYTLGTLNLSLYMMITKDVIYFAIIFVLLLFVPFATALKKMYSFYEVDNMNHATHALASYKRTYGDLFWRMLGSDVRKDIEIGDPNYAYIKIIGEIYIAIFAVAAVAVALNMFIATLDHTYKNIMENVDKEYVFSRTKMWIEYIAEGYLVLPPPLNLLEICWKFFLWLVIKCCCNCFQPSNETPPVNTEDMQNPRNQNVQVVNEVRENAGNQTSQPPSEAGNETSEPPSEAGNETSEPPNEAGNETSEPPNEPGNQTSQPHNEAGNETSQPPKEAGNETSQPPKEAGNETSQPPSEAGNETSQPYNEPGNQTSQPHNEAGNETSQPPKESGNQTSQPHNEAGNETSQPPSEAGNETSEPPNEAGNETSQPPKEAGNETSQPPSEAGNETSQPYNEPGNQTSQPHNEAGNETSQPPKESGNQTSQPHNEAGNETSEPPNEAGNETFQPPKEAGNETSQPPNEAGNETSEPPNEAGNETSQPPNEPGNQTSQPHNEAGKETSEPPNEAGNETSEPPNEVGNETSEPPNEAGNETSQPPNEAGNETSQPPNEPGNQTSQPHNEGSNETPKKDTRENRISIIKRLVFRYLRRSLILDSTDLDRNP